MNSLFVFAHKLRAHEYLKLQFKREKCDRENLSGDDEGRENYIGSPQQHDLCMSNLFQIISSRTVHESGLIIAISAKKE